MSDQKSNDGDRRNKTTAHNDISLMLLLSTSQVNADDRCSIYVLMMDVFVEKLVRT